MSNLFYRNSRLLILAIASSFMLAMTVVPAFGFFVARSLPKQFVPPADRDQIQVELELPPQASLAETRATTSQLREKMLRHDQVEQVHWVVGERAPSSYYNVIPRRKNTPRYAQALVQFRQVEGARAT